MNHLEKLEQFADLKDNWDGYGAVAMQPKTLLRGRELLMVLAREGLDLLEKMALVPTVCGGVQVEWHLVGKSLEMEYEPVSDTFALLFSLYTWQHGPYQTGVAHECHGIVPEDLFGSTFLRSDLAFCLEFLR